MDVTTLKRLPSVPGGFGCNCGSGLPWGGTDWGLMKPGSRDREGRLHPNDARLHPNDARLHPYEAN